MRPDADQRNRDLTAIADADFAAVRAEMTPDVAAYFDFHEARYRYLLHRILASVRDRFGTDTSSVRMLVVAPGPELVLLRRALGVRIDTLGFGASIENDGARHVEYDLRSAIDPESFPKMGEYDEILAAEVIEHLPLPPELVLRPLGAMLGSGGHLRIQTPNAARLDNRVKLLRGRNPFERMRATLDNPGHYREYTADELAEMGRAAGLQVVSLERHNYFGSGGGHPHLHAAYASLERFLPSGLREGVTVTYARGD